MIANPVSHSALQRRYIETVKTVILNDIYPEAEAERAYLIRVADGQHPFDAGDFYSGAVADPDTMRAIAEGHRTGRHLDGLLKFATIGASMIGRARLENLQLAVETVVAQNIPGDVMECGVWRGGACAFAKAVLMALGDDRGVCLADSFQGLPPPTHDADTIDLQTSKYPMLAVPRDRVRALFERLELLDDNVHFIEGWFADTLPSAPVGALSILRLDGDYYESTQVALNSLYSRVSPGGFVIIDDYGGLQPCRAATDDFRKANGITSPIIDIDGMGVYWRV